MKNKASRIFWATTCDENQILFRFNQLNANSARQHQESVGAIKASWVSILNSSSYSRYSESSLDQRCTNHQESEKENFKNYTFVHVIQSPSIDIRGTPC